MCLTPALGRQSSDFVVSLVYSASVRTTGTTQRKKKKRVKGPVVSQGWPIPAMSCQRPFCPVAGIRVSRMELKKNEFGKSG